MTDDQRAIQLQQLANIVIDAYLNRDNRFRPDFGNSSAVFFGSRPDADKDHPDLQVGYWYDRSDFEPGER